MRRREGVSPEGTGDADFIVGQAPLKATVFEMERLRCNTCGEMFTAEPPQLAGGESSTRQRWP